MIPRIIHLCWLSGDPYPMLIQKCIDSWRKKLPEYEIMLWDRNRLDINSIPWVKEAYENKKYAFAADYIRFYALYNYGGIYLDADVEVLKSFDDLLTNTYILGEEASGDIEAAIIGAEKGAKWIKECLNYYENRHFIKNDGTFDTRPVPLLVNKIARKNNLKILNYTFFSPKDYNIGNINTTDDTYCIHHFDGKWVKSGFLNKIKKLIHKSIYVIVGRKGHNAIIRFIRPFIGH